MADAEMQRLIGGIVQKVDDLGEKVDRLRNSSTELTKKVAAVCAQEAARSNLCAEHRHRIEAIEGRMASDQAQGQSQQFQRGNLKLTLLVTLIVALLGTGTGLLGALLG